MPTNLTAADKAWIDAQVDAACSGAPWLRDAFRAALADTFAHGRDRGDDDEWSRKDPVTWVMFMLGRLAAVTASPAFKTATGVPGDIIYHAVRAASAVAYLDKDRS